MELAKIALVTALILAISQASAVESDIKNSCADNEEPLISISDTSGGHIGEPTAYSKKVCIRGAAELEIRQDCREAETQVFSIFALDNAHISSYPDYKYSVCSQGLRADLRTSCLDNQTEALSIYSDDNSHVGNPSVFQDSLCLYRPPPKNITVELSGISGDFYADDQPLSTGDSLSLVEYPYAVSESNDMTSGIVSYGDFVKLSRPETDAVSMTQKSSAFLLPYMAASHQEIEDEQEQVNEKRFLNLLSPSFSYPIPENPYVKVVLKPDQQNEGFRDTLRNDIGITVRNEGLEDGNVLVSFNED